MTDALNLDDLMPVSRKVAAGKITLDMPEPSAVQTAELVRLLGTLELERIAKPLIGIMAKNKGELDLKAMLGRLQESGAELIAAARPVLGEQLGRVVVDAAVTCLDCQDTFELLRRGSLIPEDSKPTTKHGAYLHCEAVVGWARANVTFRQAAYIVGRALEMIDLVDTVGNLLGALMESGEDAPGENTGPALEPEPAASEA